MAAIFQTKFSNGFSWMKIYEFRLTFHWSLFLGVQLTIFQHWFRWWLGADQATSHYLNQWWLDFRRIYTSLGLNELTSAVAGLPLAMTLTTWYEDVFLFLENDDIASVFTEPHWYFTVVIAGLHKHPATVDHPGNSMHYKTSANCCGKAFYCNGNGISNTRNYLILYIQWQKTTIGVCLTRLWWVVVNQSP